MSSKQLSESMSDDDLRIVLVGCGAAKRAAALEPGTLRPRRWPAKDLYTSAYFAKKRQYARTVADQWAVLSAEHAVLFPETEIQPYDTTIDDLDADELEAWVDRMGAQLEEWVAYELGDGAAHITIEVLAGQDYVEPIRSPLTVWSDKESPVTVRFPFDETSGIGDQMRWLGERVAASRDSGAIEAATDGGVQHGDE